MPANLVTFRLQGPAEAAMLRRAQVLRAELQRMMSAASASNPADLLPSKLLENQAVQHPRTARVNTLKCSVQEALEALSGAAPLHGSSASRRAAGKGTKRTSSDAADGVEEGRSRKRQKLCSAAGAGTVDTLLPDLLVFPVGVDLHAHPLVKYGRLVLQSKASCMPAHALKPTPGWTVVDCCAAPGNKTTHLAALMRNQGTIYAYDKDPRRLERLKQNAALTGATCISAQLQDFLSINPASPDFADVKGVLLDPSCSGSGTVVSRKDHLLPSHNSFEEGKPEAQQLQHPSQDASDSHAPAGGDDAVRIAACRDTKVVDAAQHPPAAAAAELPDSASGAEYFTDDRIEQLARFQEAALRHALRFPALRRLVYSTCSVHVRENEEVVRAVMPEAQELGFQLADPFPGTWHRRCVS